MHCQEHSALPDTMYVDNAFLLLPFITDMKDFLSEIQYIP